MEHPNRVAFCKLLFAWNGGTFNERNMPVVSKDSWVRGSCDRAFDCLECTVMLNWLDSLKKQGWAIGWECDFCLKETDAERHREDMQRSVEGFYQSGWRSRLAPDDPEFDEDKQALEGCTRCGWETNFLQLVLRRHKL